MKKVFISVLFLFSFAKIISQPQYSVQINGGLLYPNGADKGLVANLQLNYFLKESNYIYLSTGILNWDKKYIFLSEQGKIYSSHSEDDHELISFYSGYHLILKSVKTFKIFVDAEIGYNYLSYNSYKNFIEVIEEDEHITKYIFGFDPSSRKRVSKNLFGVGLGTGIKNMLTENFGMSVELKMNKLFYSTNYTITHYTLSAGFIFGL